MNKLVLVFLLSAGLAACETVPERARVEAVNPLTYTDIPDNDVIRVGEDYYMVSTTMFFCPGAPIMHSRDLVHWRIVSYVFDVLEDDGIYNLRDGKNAYGSGQWATSLRYHEGMYYALFVANDQRRTYLFKTPDIEKGPWERYVFPEGVFFHDPSLLFDDGRVWVVWGNGDLRLTELEADGCGVKGEDRVIISSPQEGWGLRAEGAHFYHIDPYYYVLEIDWPKDGIRQATCWRSKEMAGPYESRVVLHGTLDGRLRDGIAQGPMVDTQYGDWYAIQFQDHGAVGRIPTLQPVTWEDGWPIMGAAGTPVRALTVNLPPDPEGDYVWASDDFSQAGLALVWQWNHKAPDDWSLTERPGWLRLRAHRADSLANARGTLTQRTVGPRCISEVHLDGSAMQPGGEAGICAFQSNSIRIGLQEETGGRCLVIKERERELYRQAWNQPDIYLRIRYVFTPEEAGDEKDMAFVGWSADGRDWQEWAQPLHMQYTLDYFTGYRSGLYHFTTLQEGGAADFDDFRQRVY